MHVKTVTLRFKNPQIDFCELFVRTNYSGKAEPHCQVTPIEVGSPHEAICAGLSIYVYQFFIPTDSRA
jgi:hypothetical protein